MNKKIFLLLLFVLALVSMSAISAADVNDNNQTLTLDSSSDISEVSDNVLAESNDNEIQQISYSDDLLGDKVATLMHAGMPENCREGQSVDTMFYVSPNDYDEDIDIDPDYEWGIMQYDDKIKTAQMEYDEDRTDTYETDIFSAFFYNIPPLTPGYHYFSFSYLGNDETQPCSANFYWPYKLQEGSKIIFTDFLPGLTDGKIIMDYGDSIYVTFRAISEKTGHGLRNVPFNFQLDNNPIENKTTDTDGELSVLLEKLIAGNHVLKITTADNNFPVEYNLPITVLHVPVYLDVDPEDLNLVVGDKGSIDAELIPAEAGGANFVSSNANVVTVDNAGNYEAIGVGEANITVRYPGDHIYAAAEVVVPVTVSKIETNIVVEDYEPLELDVEETGRIVAILNPLEAGSVIFNSSNKSVVTVDNKGNYKAIREGEANITLSYRGNNRYMAAEDVVVSVTVSKIETSIIVDPEYLDLDLEVDDEDYIGASIDPPEAGSVIFTSSNESVVTVDNKGHYKAVGEGKANITLSYAGNYKYTAAEDITIPAIVSKIENNINIDSEYLDLDLEVDDEDRIIAWLDYPDGGRITFTSSNESVVTVDNNGNYKAVGEGEANITLSYPGNYKYTAAEDIIIPVIVSKIETTIFVYEDYLELHVGDSDIILKEFNPPEAGNITFTSSNESVVTVDNNGNVKTVSKGEANITVSFAGDYKYTSCEAIVAVKVSMIETSINLNSKDYLELHVGDEDSINAELIPPKAGVITFTSSDESVVIVDNKGNLVAVGEGKANITLSYRGNSRCAAAENVTVTVNVSKIDTKIKTYFNHMELFVGDEDIIIAELRPNEAGNITFTSSDETVVTVDNVGNLVAVGEGEANITISFDGNNKYKAVEAIINVSVSKKSVRIELRSNDTLELNVYDVETIIAFIVLDDGSEMIPQDLLDSLEYNAYSDDDDDDDDFDDSAEDIIEVDDQGNVIAVGEGKAIIVISFSGNDKYEAADDINVSVIVSMVETSINLTSKDSLELFVGDEDSINAKLNPDDAGNITFTSSDESVVTVDDYGNLVAVGEGEAEITLSFDGDERYVAAEDVIVTVTVSKIDTSITADKNSLDLHVGDEDSITAVLNPEEAGNITYTSSDETVVTVDSEGNIIAVGEGEAEITLTFTGDEKYVAADDVIVTVTVSKIETNISVDEDSLDLHVGDEDSITAVLNPEEAGNITFTSSDESVVTVNREGYYIAVGEGEANITISFIGNNKYKAAEDIIITVTVSKIDTHITADKDSLEMYVEDEDSITAVLNPEEAGNITYTSSDETVVTVDNKGNLIAVGEGEAEITLTFTGDEKYVASEDVIVTVTVSKIDTHITADKDSLEMYVEDEDQINAELNPEEAGNITYTSSDETVITVDNKGNLITVGEGEAIITISFTGNNKYKAAEDINITVTVSKIDTHITADKDSLEMYVEDEDQINAELNPEEAGNITYTSSDETVVTVDNKGNLIAVGEGETNITISFAGNNKYEAAEDIIITVTVSKIDTGIIVDDSLELNVGDEESIDAELNPEEAGHITYTSSDETVVTVDSKGNIIAVSEGEAVITLSFAGDDKYTDCEATVAVTVSKIDTSIFVDKDSLEFLVDDEYFIIAEINPEEAGYITFTSSNESVVTVDDEGNVKAVGNGEAVITLSFAGDDKYRDCEATVAVSVSKIDTSIRVDEDYLDLFTGDEKSIVAILVVDYDSGMIPISRLKSLNYTSSDESVVTVDDEGNVKAVGNGEAVITISFAGDYKYNAAEDETIPVTVSLKDASISAEPKYLDLHVGENSEINYFITPDDLNVKFASTNESVATVKKGDGFVVVTAVGKGNAAITLTVGDDVVYAMNSTTIPVTVSKIATEIAVDDSLTLNVGDKKIIDLTTTPDGLDVIYESNDTSVAVVNNYGIITAVSNGTALITIKIKEDAIYKSSQATVTAIVYPKDKKEKEELNITVDANDIIAGEDAIIMIFGLENATGTIIITVDGKTYAVPIYNGEATLDIPDLDAGNYIIPIYYPGDDNYDPVNIYVNLTVGEDKSDVISTNDVTKYYGDDERYVVVITDYEGKPVAGKNVSFIINGVPYTRTTNDDGYASIALNLASGLYNITVTVDNKTTTSQVNILPTVNGTDVVKVLKNGTQYYATFRDRQGNYLKAGTTVRFNINGVFYDHKVFGDKGLAKLNINLPAGEYIITAMNLVTGENTANKIKVIPRLIENKDIVKYYKNGTQYTVKVINSDGTAVGAGVVVTFNINGVFYTRITNESGIAKLNINLQPGDYIITAEYLDCKVSNNIKVLSVLSANDMSMRYHDGSKFTANLVDDQGKAYVGQTVQFNINGVLYSRVTDSLGQAKLNINLMAGKYIITSSYNGLNIANTITIAA